MAQENKIKGNILIIQYTKYTETLKLEDQDVDNEIQAAFQRNVGQILSIMLNGKVLYVKSSKL